MTEQEIILDLRKQLEETQKLLREKTINPISDKLNQLKDFPEAIKKAMEQVKGLEEKKWEYCECHSLEDVNKKGMDGWKLHTYQMPDFFMEREVK